MSYAIVCKLKNVRKHPNAHSLMIADAAGYQVIVGLDHNDGDMGLMFPEGLEISPSLAMHAKLYRKHPQTGEAMGGYVEANGRVDTTRLRGEESRGLWIPVSTFVGLRRYTYDSTTLIPITNPSTMLVCDGTTSPDGAWTSDYNIVDFDPNWAFQEGQQVDALWGVPLCRKYMSRATRKARTGQDGVAKARSPEDDACTRHYDTGQFRESHEHLPAGTWYATLKMHGTSGRTGRVMVRQKRTLWQKAVGLLTLGLVCPSKKLQVVTGTRRVAPITEGTKLGSYRWEIHQELMNRLEPGEIWYYEIVGYDPQSGLPIMGSHNLARIKGKDKELYKELVQKYHADHVVFDYGQPPGTYGVYVYRIVKGGRELTYNEIVNRLEHAKGVFDGFRAMRNFHVVPLLNRKDTTKGDRWTIHDVDMLTRGTHDLERSHPREGVVIHVERDGERVGRPVKHKSWIFCVIEGISANDPTFIDREDAV